MHVTWSVIFKLVRIKENLVVNCNNYCWYVWIANVCWSILTWASDGSLVSSLTNVSPPYSYWKSLKNTLLKWSPCQKDNHLLHPLQVTWSTNWICIVPLNTLHDLQRIPASRHNIDSFIYMFFTVSEVNVHIFNRHKWEWIFQLSRLLLILQYLASRTLLSDC